MFASEGIQPILIPAQCPPLYVRHKKQAAGIGFEEPVPVADGIARLQTNLAAFLHKVTVERGL